MVSFQSDASSRFVQSAQVDGDTGTSDHALFRELLQNRESRSIENSGIDLHRLSAYQRALLIQDGTVTQFIEAYTLDPIDVIRLRQARIKLEHDHTWLQVTSSTEVVAREVFLRGRHSGIVYVYAQSLLLVSRIPEKLLQNLDIEPGGIGRALLNSQIENRRELLWFGRESVSKMQEERASVEGDFLSRTYRVMVSGTPIMLINEKFPADLRDP